METKFIIAIVAGSIMVLLLLIYFVISVRNEFKEAYKRESIERMYADRNLAKMEYDFIDLDSESARILAMRESRDSQMSIDDVLSEINSPDDPVYGKMDNDGPEEITGTYNPDQ